MFLLKRHQPYAFVLSGGGALAFAHIGVLRHCATQKIKPEFLVGTSMGSIISAYYGLYGELDSFVDKLSKAKLPTQLWKDLNFLGLGLVTGKQIERLLKESFADKRFEDCHIPVKINASDLNSGRMVVFEKGPLLPALRASIAIPGLIPPLVHNNQVLVDGGVVNNMPIQLVPDGYRIIAVNVTSSSHEVVLPAKDIRPRRGWTNIGQYFALLQKSITIYRNRLEEYMVQQNPHLIYLSPDMKKYTFMSFDAYPQLIKLGEQAAKKVTWPTTL